MEFLLDGRTAGQIGGGLRRAGQERDAAALLRHREGSDRIHGGPQPVQAGAIPARHDTSRFIIPDRIRETKPDYVVILPWNLKDEIMEQLQFIREWGGRFVVPIPKVADLLSGKREVSHESRSVLWRRRE